VEHFIRDSQLQHFEIRLEDRQPAKCRVENSSAGNSPDSPAIDSMMEMTRGGCDFRVQDLAGALAPHVQRCLRGQEFSPKAAGDLFESSPWVSSPPNKGVQ
jgi:hypothetical protein